MKDITKEKIYKQLVTRMNVYHAITFVCMILHLLGSELVTYFILFTVLLSFDIVNRISKVDSLIYSGSYFLPVKNGLFSYIMILLIGCSAVIIFDPFYFIFACVSILLTIKYLKI